MLLYHGQPVAIDKPVVDLRNPIIVVNNRHKQNPPFTFLVNIYRISIGMKIFESLEMVSVWFISISC